MIKFKHLLTSKINKNIHLVNRERLASGMAHQILNYYPRRAKPSQWEKYKTIRGVLLADEVGGGKTFESLALLSRAFLKASRNSKNRFRVLIIAAPSIRSKWEWCEGKSEHCRPSNGICKDCVNPKKFDLHKFLSQIKLPETKEQLLKNFVQPKTSDQVEARKITGRKDWKAFCDRIPRQGMWISSINALPPTIKKGGKIIFKRTRDYDFPKNAFDWIIADEAHVVRSGYKIDDDETSPVFSNSTVRKIYALLNSNPRAKLLILTATPFQNSIKELIQMIKLLGMHDEGDIIEIVSAGLKEAQKRITAFKDDDIEFNEENTYQLYQGLQNDITRLLGPDLRIDLRRPKELRRNNQRDGLDDYMRDLIVRNRKKRLKQDCVPVTLSETEKLQYLFFRDLVHEKEKELYVTEKEPKEKELIRRRSMVSQKLSQLVSSPEAFRRSIRNVNNRLVIKQKQYERIMHMFGGNLLFQKKLEALIHEIEEAIKDNSEKKVVVVYSRFIPTLNRIELELESRFSEDKIFRLDGNVKPKERKGILNKVEKANHDGSSPIVFLVSQVGNEGLDFDKFSRTVIHFDGHYNPAVIDQRNGRVYRGGNSAKNVRVKQVLLKDTYDQRIKFIEMEKRQLKDFYLGDSTLHEIFEKILRERHLIKKKYLGKLLNFKIDLEPRREWLLKQVRKEIY